MERMGKVMSKGNRTQNVRKLLSIYKYRVSSINLFKASTYSLAQTEASSPTREIREEYEYDQKQLDSPREGPQEKLDGPDLGKFTSCMHFYKRDLTPVKENFVQSNLKTPYRQSFEQYDLTQLSKNFKTNLANSMGEGVKCHNSGGGDKRITTFSSTTETTV
jgi:hypothetical protein